MHAQLRLCPIVCNYTMPSLKNTRDRKLLFEQLYKVKPESQPQWGSLTAPRMLCHLSDGLAMALGDISLESLGRKKYQRFPLKHLILYVIQFPKNVQTMPELLSTEPSSFEADRARVVVQIERLAAKANGVGPEHPLLGVLTNTEWKVLQYKHIEHHLRQFGC